MLISSWPRGSFHLNEKYNSIYSNREFILLKQPPQQTGFLPCLYILTPKMIVDKTRLFWDQFKEASFSMHQTNVFVSVF